MAFKVDFSKLNRGTRAPESPYAYTDDMHFARNFKDEEPRRGTVKVTLNQRTITMGLSDIAVPAEALGKRVDLILMGQRADDWRETVIERLSTERTDILDAVEDLRDADWDLADNVSTQVDVEGYWKKRWWKDSNGKWQSSLEMHVARFTLDGAEKGRLPEFK